MATLRKNNENSTMKAALFVHSHLDILSIVIIKNSQSI